MVEDEKGNGRDVRKVTRMKDEIEVKMVKTRAKNEEEK